MRRTIVSTTMIALVLTSLGAVPSTAAEPPAPARTTVADDAPSVGTVVFDQPIAGQEPGIGSRRDVVVFRNGALTNLTRNVVDPETDFLPSSYGPSLSPDGGRILYTHCEYATFFGSMRGSLNELCSAWVMNVDGSGKRRVERPDESAIQGSGWWSTDFDLGTGGEAVYTDEGVVKAFDPDTGVERTVNSSTTYWWDMARWLGPGRLVLSGSLRDADGYRDYAAQGEIFSIGADGTGAVNLTKTPDVDEYYGHGSPEGSAVGYIGRDEWGNYLPMVMNADGTGKHQIYTGNTFYPDEFVIGWSTDEDHYGMIVGDTDGQTSFAVLPVDGSTDPTTTGLQEVLHFDDEAGVDWHGDVDLRPIADDQELTVPQNGEVAFALTGRDPDGTPLTWTVLTQPNQGSLVGTAPQLTYRPATDYTGPDQFTFRVSSNGLDSRAATVRITVVDECTIKGTKKKDVLTGTSGNDVICGLGNADVILGGGGDDVIFGGGGDDDLVGGSGDDRIDGGLDDDAVRGDAGNDVLIGGKGLDAASYFKAPDGVRLNLDTQTGEAGRFGTDRLTGIENGIGSGGADTLIGDEGLNRLDGLTGGDTVKGGGGDDLIRGGGGHDTLLGANGRDLVWGGTGKDLIRGGLGKDICYLEDEGRKATSCENEDGASTSRVTVRAPDGVDRRYGALYWKLGNNDYAYVYSPAVTAGLKTSAFPDARDWESAMCRFLKNTPVKGACTANSLLQLVQKSQVQWFISYAVRSGGCGILIYDKGHHGLKQWQTRWKVRPAQNYFNHVAEASVTPGKISWIETSDPSEVGGNDYIGVRCP